MTYRTAVLRAQRQACGTLGRRYILTGSVSREMGLSVREMLAAVLAFFIFSLSLWSGYEIRSVSNDLILLERDAAQLDARAKILKGIDARYSSPERLEQMARRLNFHKPEAAQVVRLGD